MRIGDVLIWERDKDGGPESKVDGLWIFRWKKLFTIAWLTFHEGSREADHSHAFNAWSWLVEGKLEEHVVVDVENKDSELHGARFINWYHASWRPIFTPRERMHRVYGMGKINKVLTFRGPWVDQWREQEGTKLRTLTHNRVITREREL